MSVNRPGQAASGATIRLLGEPKLLTELIGAQICRATPRTIPPTVVPHSSTVSHGRQQVVEQQAVAATQPSLA